MWRMSSTRDAATIDPVKIKQMKAADGIGSSTIAKTLKISRASVYRALEGRANPSA